MTPEDIQRIKCNKEGQMVFSEPSLFSFFYRNGSYMLHAGDEEFSGKNNIYLTGFIGHMPYSTEGGIKRRNAVSGIISRSVYLCGVNFHVNNYQMILFIYRGVIKKEYLDDAVSLMSFSSAGILQVWPVLKQLSPHISK